jgi:hypothetical protein
MSEKKTKTFTCQVRLQRTTVEYGYVNIALSPEIMSGESNVNAQKIIEAAITMSQQPQMVWYPESQQTILHPDQDPSVETCDEDENDDEM